MKPRGRLAPMSFERDSQGLFVRARRWLARPRGQGQSVGLLLVVALVLGALSSLALVAGVTGWPFPRRPTRSDELWWRFDGAPQTVDSYLWYAITISLVTITVWVVGTIVVDRGTNTVLPAWVGGVQVIAWAAALVIVVGHWIRGDDFANYLPASSDTGGYIFAVFILSAVLGALIVLRVLRRRIIREKSKRG
jgi:hypothetical protein